MKVQYKGPSTTTGNRRHAAARHPRSPVHVSQASFQTNLYVTHLNTCYSDSKTRNVPQMGQRVTCAIAYAKQRSMVPVQPARCDG